MHTMISSITPLHGYCSRYLRKFAFIAGCRWPLKEKSSRSSVGGIGEIEHDRLSDRSKRVNRNREHVTKRIENGFERTNERARTPTRKREKPEERHEPRINFARLTATVTSYINSKEGFPISVRAFSRLCRPSMHTFFLLFFFFFFFHIINIRFRSENLDQISDFRFSNHCLSGCTRNLYYTFEFSSILFPSLVHEFSTFASIRKEKLIKSVVVCHF